MSLNIFSALKYLLHTTAYCTFIPNINHNYIIKQAIPMRLKFRVCVVVKQTRTLRINYLRNEEKFAKRLNLIISGPGRDQKIILKKLLTLFL